MNRIVLSFIDGKLHTSFPKSLPFDNLPGITSVVRYPSGIYGLGFEDRHFEFRSIC